MKLRLLLIIIFLTASASNSWALSCMQPDIAKDIQNENMIVFEGTVITDLTPAKEDKFSKGEIPIRNFSEQTHLLSVDKVWMPSEFIDKDIRIAHTPWMSSIFNVDHNYLVFAELIEGRLVTSICGNTRLLQNAQKELEFLDKNLKQDK